MVASSWTWMVALMSGRSRRISRLRLWPTLVMRSPHTMRLVGMSVMTMLLDSISSSEISACLV